MSSVAGWLITVVGSRLVENMTDHVLRRVGLVDATCERCATRKPAVEIREHSPTTLTCGYCGHQGTVTVGNIDTLIVHQVNSAEIHAGVARIYVDSGVGSRGASNIQAPNLPARESSQGEFTSLEILGGLLVLVVVLLLIVSSVFGG